jgi:hypothetical protein
MSDAEDDDDCKTVDLTAQEGRMLSVSEAIKDIDDPKEQKRRSFMQKTAYVPGITVVLGRSLIDRVSHVFVIRGWSGILRSFLPGEGFCCGTVRCGKHICYMQLLPHSITHGQTRSIGIFIGVNNVTTRVQLKSRVAILPPPNAPPLPASLTPSKHSSAGSILPPPPVAHRPPTAAAVAAAASDAAAAPGAAASDAAAAPGAAASDAAARAGKIPRGPRPRSEFFGEDAHLYVYTNNRNCLGWNAFALQSELEESGMIANDQIVLRLEIEIPSVVMELEPSTAPESTTSAFFYPDPHAAPSTLVGSSWTVPNAVDSALTLQDRMRKLLDRGVFPDVHIQSSDGYLLPAHKAILTARSPMFDAALQIGMREHKENVIHMPKCSAVVAQALLCFLYAGKIVFPISLGQNPAAVNAIATDAAASTTATSTAASTTATSTDASTTATSTDAAAALGRFDGVTAAPPAHSQETGKEAWSDDGSLETDLYLVQELNWAQLLELYDAGVLYEVPNLDEWCVSQLRHTLNPSNVLLVMKAMAPHGLHHESASRCLKIANEYLAANIETVFIPEELKAKSMESQSQAKKKIKKRKRLGSEIRSEIFALMKESQTINRAIQKWIYDHGKTIHDSDREENEDVEQDANNKKKPRLV